MSTPFIPNSNVPDSLFYSLFSACWNSVVLGCKNYIQLLTSIYSLMRKPK